MTKLNLSKVYTFCSIVTTTIKLYLTILFFFFVGEKVSAEIHLQKQKKNSQFKKQQYSRYFDPNICFLLLQSNIDVI